MDECETRDCFHEDETGANPSDDSTVEDQIEPLLDDHPARIGPYKILSKLGEGGFGVVYEALQKSPVKRRVALKIIKPGMDSKKVIARFEAERQALALMTHPNIAKVLGGGLTERGLPYFVMELVRGEPITDFCDRNRMTIEERLKLLITVCHAVQHAHAKAVIHRDIKPSNILVGYDSEGHASPTVIDFGVAKALNQQLTEKTLFTNEGQLIGTPEYMSPEQAEMSSVDVDTRTDVYSLGVVLYELLTGMLPFEPSDLRGKMYGELQRLIREQEPPRPSTRLSSALSTIEKKDTAVDAAKKRHMSATDLPKHLRGELDWVVMKCLEKDRDRRYATPTALAEELQHYLANEPIAAKPPSALYRFQKVLKRNTIPVVVATAFIIVLMLGITATSVAMYRAREEARTARAAEEIQMQLSKSEKAARELAQTKTIEAERERDTALKARERIEFNTYVSNIRWAQHRLALGFPDLARELLNACPEQLRKWEWYWLNARLDTSLFRLEGHSKAVTNATFSPDGKTIATSSWDNTARVWDSTTGESLWELRGHEAKLQSVEFSSDGTKIVTTSSDNTARVWGSQSGHQLAVLRSHTSSVLHAEFSSDDNYILTASMDGTVKIWDAVGYELIHNLDGHRGPVYNASFDPSGHYVASASEDNTAIIWSLKTGRVLHRLEGHTDDVRAVSFSPDGKSLVTASADKTGIIWDTKSGRAMATLKGHGSFVWSAEFNGEGDKIVTASHDETARVWDANTGEVLHVLSGHHGYIRSAHFSPGNFYIVTSSGDRTARVWDASTGELGVILDGNAREGWEGHTNWVTDARFNQNGSRIVTASHDGTAQVWMMPQSGEWVYSNNSWSSRREREKFGVQQSNIFSNQITKDRYISAMRSSLGVRQDGYLTTERLVGPGDRVLRSVDDQWVVESLEGEMLATIDTAIGTILAVHFRKDGGMVGLQYMSAESSSTDLFDTNTGDYLYTLDGRLGPEQTDIGMFAVATGNVLSLVRMSDGEKSVEMRGHEDRVSSVSFNASGAQMASGSEDGTVRVWDTDSGECLVVFDEQMFRPALLEFSKDSRHLAALSHGGVRVWNMKTERQEYFINEQDSRVKWFAISPDGTRIITLSDDGFFRVYNFLDGEIIIEIKIPESDSAYRYSMNYIGSCDAIWAFLISANYNDQGFELCVLDIVPGHIWNDQEAAGLRGEDGYGVVDEWLQSRGLLPKN